MSTFLFLLCSSDWKVNFNFLSLFSNCLPSCGYACCVCKIKIFTFFIQLRHPFSSKIISFCMILNAVVFSSHNLIISPFLFMYMFYSWFGFSFFVVSFCIWCLLSSCGVVDVLLAWVFSFLLDLFGNGHSFVHWFS